MSNTCIGSRKYSIIFYQKDKKGTHLQNQFIDNYFMPYETIRTTSIFFIKCTIDV